MLMILWKLLNMTFQDICYNKSFSQLAKESSFTFNLYRGRVDWKKLEELDVDRVVRDQDVELLNIYLSNVTNCNLESEYDVKILDPNFIKLFRLAQLLIDFLLHCKKYLEHCIKVAHESLQTSNKEVEIMRKQLQARKAEVKQLKKKVKEVKQQLLYSPRISGPSFECSLCGKVFMSETFLHGHHSRRHQPHPYSLVLRPFNTPASPHIKIVAQENEEKTKNTEDVTKIKMKYQEEIEDLKKLFFAEIEKLKLNDTQQKSRNSLDCQLFQEEKEEEKTEPKQTQSESIVKDLPNVLKETGPHKSNTQHATKGSVESSKVVENQELQREKGKEPDLNSGSAADSKHDNVKEGKGEEEWLRRLEEREGVWRARLSSLDQQHKKQVQQLQEKLNSSHLQGQEMKRELEDRLKEVLTKFEQSQKLLERKTLNTIQQKLETIKEINSDKAEKNMGIKMLPEEIPLRESLKQPPPFQKRRAFVSQKSKTIQDQESFEIPQKKESDDNLVEVLNPDNESDLENVSILTQNSSREMTDKNDLVDKKKTPPVITVKDNSYQFLSRSENKENIITRLLEEEKLRNLADKKQKSGVELSFEEEESSFTESGTETESESEMVERGREEGTRLESESSDDRLLREESNLAQQSLQSMEALLAANPGILQQLKSDLEELVNRRLQNLGLDPSWSGLPPSTYRDKTATLTHQRNITAKNHKVYFTLRDKLNADAETAVHSRRSRSSADSLLARLRNKAAQIINAAKFTRHLGSVKKQDSLLKSNALQLMKAKPLASSSPQLSPRPLEKPPSVILGKRSDVVTKIQSHGDDSFSLSSSTYEEEEQIKGDGDKNITPTLATPPHTQASEPSYKSALRNAVSTGNLAKKKVLFVDEAMKDGRRSHSETMVTTDNLGSSSKLPANVSVASLVQEIQQQLGARSGKPAFSVDLMKQKQPEPAKETSEIPLSQILPLTKSGRELLEYQSNLSKDSSEMIQLPRESSLMELKSPKSSEPLSHILLKVPTTKASQLASLGKKPDLLETSNKSQLLPPRLSPAPSLSSIGSSLLDLSGSPRALRRPVKGSLEWDLQDLEENMKD